MKSIEATLLLRNNLIKKRRLEAGLTQVQMAEAIGIRVNVYQKAEQLHTISVEDAKKIADYFERTIDELFPEELKGIKSNRIVREINPEQFILPYNSEEAQKLIEHKNDVEDSMHI